MPQHDPELYYHGLPAPAKLLANGVSLAGWNSDWPERLMLLHVALDLLAAASVGARADMTNGENYSTPPGDLTAAIIERFAEPEIYGVSCGEHAAMLMRSSAARHREAADIWLSKNRAYHPSMLAQGIVAMSH